MTTFCRKVNGKLVYPFTVLDLKKLFPNVSMPQKVTDETFLKFRANPVHIQDLPEIDSRTQKIVTGELPEWVESEDGPGRYEIVHTIVEKTAEEVARDAEAEASTVRETRNELLKDTDYYALSDVEMPESVATYRQALRDLSAHPNFPYLNPEDWPELEVL
jgi:hypothetical protein